MNRRFIAMTCLAVVGLLSTLNIFIAPGPLSKACAGVMVVFVIVNLWISVVTRWYVK